MAYLPLTPLRLRVGGNSVDVSTYIKSQTQFLNITDPNAQKDHIPVNFGPTLLTVISKVGKDIGGVEYIVGEFLVFLSTLTDPRHDLGLSLAEPGDQTVIDLAVAANQTLGDQLDALALGNVDLVQAVLCSISDGVLHWEPDLYHGRYVLSPCQLLVPKCGRGSRFVIHDATPPNDGCPPHPGNGVKRASPVLGSAHRVAMLSHEIKRGL